MSTLKFITYAVPKVKAEINQNFNFQEPQNITLKPQFRRDIIKISDKEFHNQLTVVIDDNETPIPFSIEVSIKGAFALENWEDASNKDLVNTTSTATLFPYLRSLISQVSAMLNMPPYILPLLNINELFKD